MSEDPFHSHVRLTGAERGKLLARLDEAPGRPGRDRRRHKRWEYRMSARPDTRGGWSRSRPRAVPPAWGRCARPGLRRMVSDFIDEAQRKANQIEKSLAAETGNPRDACVELLGAAAGYGFDAMTEAARDALAALDTTEKRKDAEGPLRRLVAICRRLRCATRVRPGLAAREALSSAVVPGLRLRLSVMMFLQYAIWGAWLPLLWPFLANHRQFSGDQVGHMFMVGAVGALVAPWVAGQVADRWFATEKFLAISHVLGGLLVWQLAWIESYGAFLAFSLLYSLIYAPTLSLTNSISFHHLPDRDRDFGRVRVWGTVGWIAAGITIGQWLLHHHTPAVGPGEFVDAARYAGMADAFRVSAVLGVILGIYCLTLPHTPPSPGRRASAAAEALGEIRRNPLLTLFLLAVPISCIHQFYFVHTADFLAKFQSRTATVINDVFGVGGAGLMTVGQMSEIVVLAAIPLIAKRVSRKSLLAVGIAAYALRMALFAWVDAIAAATGLPAVAILIAGVALHGLCFGCFIFVAFMVVDEETTGDVRASAQSLFNLVIVGVGIIAGSWIATSVVPRWATVEGSMSYTRLFSVPMWASIACLAVLLAFYPRRPEIGDRSGFPRGG